MNYWTVMNNNFINWQQQPDRTIAILRRWFQIDWRCHDGDPLAHLLLFYYRWLRRRWRIDPNVNLSLWDAADRQGRPGWISMTIFKNSSINYWNRTTFLAQFTFLPRSNCVCDSINWVARFNPSNPTAAASTAQSPYSRINQVPFQSTLYNSLLLSTTHHQRRSLSMWICGVQNASIDWNRLLFIGFFNATGVCHSVAARQGILSLIRRHSDWYYSTLGQSKSNQIIALLKCDASQSCRRSACPGEWRLRNRRKFLWIYLIKFHQW